MSIHVDQEIGDPTEVAFEGRFPEQNLVEGTIPAVCDIEAYQAETADMRLRCRRMDSLIRRLRLSTRAAKQKRQREANEHELCREITHLARVPDSIDQASLTFLVGFRADRRALRFGDKVMSNA
jgi:hypothetical protein